MKELSQNLRHDKQYSGWETKNGKKEFRPPSRSNLHKQNVVVPCTNVILEYVKFFPPVTTVICSKTDGTKNSNFQIWNRETFKLLL